MTTAGITFNYDEQYKNPVSTTVTIRGDHNEYIGTIKSLLSLLSIADTTLLKPNELFDVCSLIVDMLPSEDQIVIHNPNYKPNNKDHE